MTEFREFYRRHLPHWQPEGATLFVTFRLAGSLPREVFEMLKERGEQEARMIEKIPNEVEKVKKASEEERRAFGRWDAALDASTTGPHWLRKPEIASILAEAFHYRDKNIYRLITFTIMSNHAHVVYTPLQNEKGHFYALDRIQQSLKRHTGRQANLMLTRQGAFWQEENYDHVVRDEAELNRIIRYVVYNPVKAGLVSRWEDWPWTFLSPDFCL